MIGSTFKNKGEQAAEILWEESREEIANAFVKQAAQMLGEDRLRKIYEQKVFWKVLRPLLSFLLPQGKKITDLGIDFSAELNDALNRYFKDGGQGQAKAGNKAAAAPVSQPQPEFLRKGFTTIRGALGSLRNKTTAISFLKKLGAAKLGAEAETKILGTQFRDFEAYGLIESLDQIADASEFKESVKLLFGVSEPKPPEPPKEKVLVWPEISNGNRHPNLERRIEELRKQDKREGTSKADVLIDYLEAIGERSEILRQIKILDKMQDDDFEVEVERIYGKSPRRFGDKATQGIAWAGKQSRKPVNGKRYTSVFDAFADGFRS